MLLGAIVCQRVSVFFSRCGKAISYLNPMEDLPQKVSWLSTKAVSNVLFGDLAKRLTDFAGTSRPSNRPESRLPSREPNMMTIGSRMRHAAIAFVLAACPLAADTPVASLPPDLDIAQLFIDDMSIANAIQPHGIDGDWPRKPKVGIGNVMPEGWDHAIMWGQIYAGRPGNPATNVRVQIRDCALWMLSRREGAWKLLAYSVTPAGHAYREDFQDDINIRADVRREADGSASVKLVPGYNFHFWPQCGRVAIDPADIAGMASCFFARLVVDDPSKPDDRDRACLLGSCGGDYWRSKDAKWKADWTSNNDWAIGRFKLLTPDWQPVTGCTYGAQVGHQRYLKERKNPPPADFARTLSAETLRKNPPPIRDLGKAR